MVNKKIVAIVSILIILFVGAVVYIKVSRLPKSQYTFINEVAENQTEDNEVSENVAKEDTTNNQEEENTVEENKEEESNSTEEDSTESNDDKAIDLVKKEWGENDSTVYYYIEEQVSDNEYLISVRDSNSTSALADYKVDIETGKVEKN